MRFYEFQSQPADRFVLAIKNYIGTAAIKKLPSKFNWAGFSNMLKMQGYELAADYETFKTMYDQMPPAIQELVLDFDDTTIQLNVPGVENNNPEIEPGQDSQNAVNQMAQGMAPQQLAQQSQTPKVTTA